MIMIPFKYYIKIYKRYIKLSIQNKKQNIKEWFSKSREEKYKYFNPDEENIAYKMKYPIITQALLNTTIIGSNMNDKIYCKDVNRQMHYSKGRIKTIINVLNSIFNEPFDTFFLTKSTNKSNEELAVDIDKSTKKMLLYFLLLLAILFIIIMLFSMNGTHLSQEIVQETSNITPQKVNHNYGIVFAIVILVIVGIYIAITLLIAIMFSIVTFIYLWKFVNKNAYITSKF